MNNLILVGFMGTGKSAVGKRLAERLGRPFVDLDRTIEKETGRSIADLFAQEGEDAFREREARAVREAAGLKEQVIAAGGGVMLREDNVKLLKESGRLVCLTASPDVILRRTQFSLPSRPLLAGQDPRARIEELLKLRAPFYALADLAIDTTNRDIEQIVEEILACVNSKP